MAFTVEDGTGVADANAYIDVAYADSYHADRGNTDWAAASTADKQAAIIRATDYIEARWANRFRGQIEHTDPLQPLSWPRLYVYDINGQLIEGMPDTLSRATAEYALRALTATLLPDPTVNPLGMVTKLREKVGPIETETEYSDKVAVPTLQPYPMADRMIRYLLRTTGGVYR